MRIPLAIAAIGALALTRTGGVGGKDEFDPLLDGGAFCGPPAGGQPAVLQALILANTETAPFQPVPAEPAMGEMPVLYENLGTLTFKAGTRNAKAQAWFDQGLRLAFEFNHAEAQRAFREAQKFDPNCALCFWGEALVLGPNINVPMMPEANAPALAALAKAVELAPRAPRATVPSSMRSPDVTRPIPRSNVRRSMPRMRARWRRSPANIRSTTRCRRFTPKH